MVYIQKVEVDCLQVVWANILDNLELAVWSAEQDTNNQGLTSKFNNERMQKWLAMAHHFEHVMLRDYPVDHHIPVPLLQRVGKFIDTDSPWA